MKVETVPEVRVHARNDEPLRPDRELVLYWMIASRRRGWNFGLQHAARLADDLGKPLVVLEPLRCGYPFASDRLHRFVLDGMAANRRAFAGGPAAYHAYVEPEAGAGRGLLEAYARRAAAVVTDDYPTFFLPRMVAAAADRLDVRLEAVDSHGLLPVSAAPPKPFARAFDFRRFLQKELAAHLVAAPAADPLAGLELPRLDGLPAEVLKRWPDAPQALLDGEASLDDLPIDHAVAPSDKRGGSAEAALVLERFLADVLAVYGQERNQVDVSSGLSPWLHFGHVSAHEVFDRIAEREDWNPSKLDPSVRGARAGFWGMSEAAEAYLDQLVTWRELGANYCARVDDPTAYASLPEWARTTLAEHADDPRPHVYTKDELEHSRTHDEIWNAAQNQLRTEGVIENYLRMLWGKKILHWTRSPEEAWEVMLELNDRYALDGRDPNSYSGIGWVLGRFDRAWGPEREVFGKIRYMTSDSTRRKLKLDAYLARWSGAGLFG